MSDVTPLFVAKQTSISALNSRAQYLSSPHGRDESASATDFLLLPAGRAID